MNEPGGGKMKMLHSFLLLSALFAAMPAAADSDEERVAAAKRYLEVAQMSKITDDTVNELAKGIPAEQRDKFLDFMHNAVRPEVLEQAAMASMVKAFTAEELNALADFLGSSGGGSAKAKVGRNMAE